MYQEADLNNGWEVRVRCVPPTASYRWQEAHITRPPRPPRPVVRIKAKADGHVEEVPALPDSTEWNIWVQQMAEWELKCEELHQEVMDQETDFSFDYALVAWRSAGGVGDVEEWTREVPEGWEFPQALITHGAAKPNNDNPVMDFINYELLNTGETRDIIRPLAFPGAGEADTSPVTQAEVEAALRSFRSPMGAPRAAGDMDDSTTSPNDRDQDVSPSQGRVDRSRPWNPLRRLVSGNKRGQDTDDSGS